MFPELRYSNVNVVVVVVVVVVEQRERVKESSHKFSTELSR
jgi:hypothetical protein